jgi:peptidoglycan/xylan/chitin deacetylase (PgdA/CDA1 family)
VITQLGRHVRARLDRRKSKRLGVALVYHRLGDRPGDPRYELVPALSQSLFEAQLRFLASTYRVVPPSQLFHEALERRSGERFPVAITFDDDLRSHVDVAAPALRLHDVPAGFFVGGASDPGSSAWWEDLQALAANGQSSSQQLRSLPQLDLTPVVQGVAGAIHQAAEMIERLPVAHLDAVAAELRARAGRSHQRLTRIDFERLAAEFELGFHTRRHHLLTKLTDEELADAMVEGREDLERIIGERVTMLAYPHGKADDRVAEAARSAGYAFGFTAYPNAVGPSTDPLMIGRIEIHNASMQEFARTIAATLAGEA